MNENPNAVNQREFDIVLFGATGFTGELVAQKLAAAPSMRWAIAGRNAEKLKQVLASLSAFRTLDGKPPEIIVADAADVAALQAIALRSKVIVSTVGPYAKYGSPLVAACAAAGTHYCDLTGEVPWVRTMIDAHHATAQASGARIVHCCGFDSIPSDISVWLLQQSLRETTGTTAMDVVGYFSDLRGGASGGTVASMMGVVDAAVADKNIRRLLMNPLALVPGASPARAKRYQDVSFGIDRKRGFSTAPFVMAAVNSRVVYRSAAIFASDPSATYGDYFAYREGQSFPLNVHNVINAAGLTSGVKALPIALAVPALRRIMQKRLPSVGEGPSESARNRGRYTFSAYGTTSSAANKASLVVRFSDNADPGYGSTSKMLSAAALSLAFDPLSSPGGVLTPSVAMGSNLITRLRDAGLSISVAAI
jgi:short subunit dehydrogenase-like uncharacterized protein